MKITTLLVALLLLLDLEAGNRLFSAGDYAGAVREYRALLEEEPESPVVHYNLGTALLRLERFEEARPHLERAARGADGPLRPLAYYNLGNAYLVPAFRARGRHAGRAELLLRAIAAYKRALLLDPDDLDAKWNLELARRLLQPPPSPQGGGGGGGGGGGDDRQRGENEPAPQSAADRGPQPNLSQAEAAQILAAAEDRELDVQRQELKKAQTRSPLAH